MFEERYNRNILIDSIGLEGQKKLLNSKVLVAGAGGLGSIVLSTLASVGIGNIGIVDNDKLEISNLNRQFIHNFSNIDRPKVESAKNWIEGFNPDISVETYQLRLDETNCDGIISGYDIVIDCFDSYESKFVLNRACIRNNKPLVHGGVAEFFGQITSIIPGQSSCLGCIFPEENTSCVLKGVISPAVNVIGSIQAMETVKILLSLEGVLVNTILSYDGIKQKFTRITTGKNPECPVCSEKFQKVG